MARDPFDDPFFRSADPFEGFGGLGGFGFPSMFGGSGGLGEGGRPGQMRDPFAEMNAMMDNMHRNMMSHFQEHSQNHIGFHDNIHRQRLAQHHHRPTSSAGSEVTIEEVPGDTLHHRSHSQPRVEEPDDEEGVYAAHPGQPIDNPRHGHGYRTAGSARRQPQPQTFSYSSSTTTVMGPGGVRESKHVSQDSMGRRRMAVRRGIGEQAREWVHDTAPDGRERDLERLHHMQEADKAEFDRRWVEQQRQLPRGRYAPQQHQQISHR